MEWVMTLHHGMSARSTLPARNQPREVLIRRHPMVKHQPEAHHWTTSKRAIIPWSSWSSMWQWIMKGPV